MAEALLEEYAVVGSVSVADIIYWGFLDADAAFTGSGDSNKGSWSGAGGYEFFSSKSIESTPVYWVRDGQVYGAIVNPGSALITFGKLGEGSFSKGHIPVSNWVTKKVVPYVTEFKSFSSFVKQTNKSEKLITKTVNELNDAAHGKFIRMLEYEKGKYIPDTLDMTTEDAIKKNYSDTIPFINFNLYKNDN